METERLRALLCENDDEGLPFDSNVNEARVLELVEAIELPDDHPLIPRIRQWILFNKALNLHEGEPYQTWVGTIYSKIEARLPPVKVRNGEGYRQPDRDEKEEEAAAPQAQVEPLDGGRRGAPLRPSPHVDSNGGVGLLSL